MDCLLGRAPILELLSFLAQSVPFYSYHSVSGSLSSGAALYRRLKEYTMTEEELKENGYPLPCPEKAGRAVVFTVEEKKTTDGKQCIFGILLLI